MYSISKYIFVLLLFLGVSLNSSFCQERQPISLETAILKGRSALSPEDIEGIEWISKELFTQYSASGVLEIWNTKGTKVDSIVPEDLNKRLSPFTDDSIKRVRPLGWNDENQFYFLHQLGVYSYNRNTKDLERVSRYPAKAENLELSNKTGRLAYTLGNDIYLATVIDSKIQVTNHEGTGVVAGVAIHRSEFGISKGLFWSEDGTKLGFYEIDESMVSDYPLASYNTIPAKIEPLKYPMAGQASQKPRVGIFDVESQKTIYLKTGAPSENYLTNFAFLPGASQACVVHVNRDQNHVQVKLYDTVNGSFVKLILEEKHHKYVEPESPPIFLSNNQMLWLSERDGFNHLYLYEIDGGLAKQITQGDFEIQDVIGLYNKERELIFLASDGLMGSALYRVSLPGGKLTKLTKRKGSYRVYGENGTNLVVKFTSRNFANEVLVMTPSGKTLSTLLSKKTAPFHEYQIGDLSFPVLKAADGTKLQGRLIKPHNFDSTKTYPVLVYVYGGPHSQLIQDNYHGGASFWMFHAANRGYLVFSLDNRGSAGRGLDFEQQTFRNLGEIELEDQLVGVDYLKGLSFVDTTKMAIHGWSYGGYMTTSMMLKYPDVFDVGVAGGPVTNWNLYEAMYTERYMDTPQENEEGYKKTDLKNYVEALQGDLLLIHGLDDDVVVPQHSYNLLEAFVDAGVQIDFFVYPGHKHNVRGKDRVHLMEKVLDYVDLHLGLSD